MNIVVNNLFREAESLKERGFFDKAKKLIKKILMLEPSCVNAHVLSGDIAFKNKNLDSAISFYNMAIKLDKECCQGWINLAVCYKDKGLLTQAQKAVIKAVKLEPDILHSYEIFADLMIEMGAINKAFQLVEIALKRCKDKEEAYRLFSKILIKNGDYAASKKVLRKAIKINPNSSDAYSILLGLAQKQNNTREALKILSQIAANCQLQFYRVCINELAKYFKGKADIKNLRIVLKKFIQVIPARERISIDCFRAYLTLEKYSEAFKVGEGLLSRKKLDGSMSIICNPWFDGRVMPRSFWKKQFSILSNAKIERRYKIWKDFYLIIIEKMLKHDKNLSEIKKKCRQFKGKYGWMRFLMISDLLKGNLKQALKELKIIIDCVPRDYFMRCKNGEVLICAGKSVEGFKQFDIAIAMNESTIGNSETWKGEMYLMTGEYKKALKSLEAGVRLKIAYAFCWRGVAYFKLGYIQKALKDIGHVIEKFPEDFEARVWMAEILRTLGKFNESLEALNFILKKYPGYDFALFNRALVYYAIGDYASMRKDFSIIDNKLKNVILDKLEIKRITNFNSADIYEILTSGLEMTKGNRRQNEYLLQIQFPEYEVEP